MKISSLIKIFVIFVLIFCNIINAQTIGQFVIPSNDKELDGLALYASTLHSFKSSPSSIAGLKKALSVLDARGIDKLKKHASYSSFGDIYMYAAFYLKNDNSTEDSIKLLDKALALRNEPSSNYNIAVLYKKLYDEAIKKNDVVKEVKYGKKIYEHLSAYIKISGYKNTKYKELIKYFSIYNK